MTSAYQRPQSPTRRRSASTARDRTRLTLTLDDRTWITADDAAAEAEQRELAERLADALVAHVGGSA